MNGSPSIAESMQEVMNKSEEMYRTLFNSIDEGVGTFEVIFDEQEKPVDLRIIDINPAFMKLSGFSRDIVGKRIREIIPGFEVSKIDRLGQVAISGESMRFEEYVSTLDSWFSCFALPIESEGNHKAAVIFQNITERKRAEDKLQRYTAWYKTIFDLIPAGIWISDHTGKIVVINKEAVNMYRGVSPFAGRPEEYASYKLFRPDTDEPVVFDPYPGEKAMNREVFDFDRFDGTRGTLVASTEALRDNDGNIINYVAIAMDITPLKQAKDALQESEKKALDLVEKLRLADQHKNNFINMLSHELRNPLASIVMSLDLLEKVIPEGKVETKTLEIAKRQSKQLTYLVDDLLDVTRIIQDKVALRKETVELNGLINKAVQDYQSQFSANMVRLDVQLTTPLYIEADPYRITQVIDNILHNAAKFTRSNDKVTITVAHDSNSREAVITVADTGRGIEPHALANLFEPFTQADKTLARSDGGLGLGLAIVKGMVELHGGRVEAFSEGIGKGARFTIWLPEKLEV